MLPLMRRDGVIALCAVALAGVYLYATLQIPRLRVGDPLGPKMFPFIIAAGLLVGAVLLIVETRRPRRAADGPGGAAEPADWRAQLALAGLLAWTLLYVALFEPLGYLLATTAFLAGLMGVLYRRHRLAGLLIAVLFAAGSHLLFTAVLDVRLPRGLLGL